MYNDHFDRSTLDNRLMACSFLSSYNLDFHAIFPAGPPSRWYTHGVLPSEPILTATLPNSLDPVIWSRVEL